NLRAFNGKPLFFHILETLEKSEHIHQVIVNTDSSEIANKARSVSAKVKIHERPEAICGDFVSMNEIIKYDLENSEDNFFIQTHSTNPLLRVKTIDQAIQAYFNLEQQYDSIFSVTRLQTRLFWENGEAINHNPAELIRTQDLPPV